MFRPLNFISGFFLACLLGWLAPEGLNGQSLEPPFYKEYQFSTADSLRGSLRPERSCYDVYYYDLTVDIHPEKKQIEGLCDIYFTALTDFTRLQIDLFDNLDILSIEMNGRPLPFSRQYHAVFITLPPQLSGQRGHFQVRYTGKPVEALDPPWDGGFVWSSDANGSPWIGVACEGVGASLWWPNKDHLSDEPDSMCIRIIVPDTLQAVANGNFMGSHSLAGGKRQYDWLVSYPINNYDVSVNIAQYAHFSDQYIALDGDSLALDYYVLQENLHKAETHFQQVHKVLACYERYFGKYPFWRDGFALIETPYLGMEHQSGIAYGNRYLRGYLGGMIPEGMDWDYIIVHETGHEYFGNSVSCNDLAELWIHESFTTYMEALFVECAYSYRDAVRYMEYQRFAIGNREPLLGPSGVNWDHWEDSDQYYKGAWVLHTLRHVINDDALWFDILRSFYQKYALGHAGTREFIQTLNQCTKKNFTAVLLQYLLYPELPMLEYRTEALENGGTKLTCRWTADVPGFDMPVPIGSASYFQLVYPTMEWQTFDLEEIKHQDFRIARELALIAVEEL